MNPAKAQVLQVTDQTRTRHEIVMLASLTIKAPPMRAGS
jgi:hypothetical protein